MCERAGASELEPRLPLFKNVAPYRELYMLIQSARYRLKLPITYHSLIRDFLFLIRVAVPFSSK